ncbi:IGSF9B (predicted) [Pycnogonum litorale]
MQAVLEDRNHVFGIFMLLTLQAAYIQGLDRYGQTESVIVDQGKNVILPCEIDFPDGIPVPHVIQWKKKGQSIPIYIWYKGYPPHRGKDYLKRVDLAHGEADRVGGASLNLTNVRESDQGWYECNIVYLNHPKPDNGTWVFLEVLAPPHFEIRPPEIEYVNIGESIFIPCKAVGTPRPIIEWYKEKKRLYNRGRYEISNRGLNIIRVNKKDVGIYVCAAINREGRAEARTALSTAGGAVITVPPQNKTQIESSKVEFICDAKAEPKNITYRWYRNGVDVTELPWQVSRTRIREHDGALVINSIAADDSGKYTCEVSNGIGAPRTAHAYLDVEYPAQATLNPKKRFLPAGLSGTLKCHFKANPSARVVTWEKDGMAINIDSNPDFQLSKNVGILHFKKVRKEHAGRYTCKPYNAYGSAGASGIIRVYVRDPPFFTRKPDPKYQRLVNGEVKFVCAGNGIPKPKVFWRRANGRSLPKPRIIIRGGNLTLKGLKKEDYGHYECVIQNEVATLVTSTLLLVESTTPHAPKNLTVIPGTFSAKLSWLPAYNGGFPQRYLIWYQEEGQNRWKELEVPESRTEIELHDLKQYTTYRFRIQSRNEKGDSMYSPVIRATTKYEELWSILPTEMIGALNTTIGVGHSLRPRNLTLESHSVTGVVLAWLHPEKPVVSVRYYSIEYSRKPAVGLWLEVVSQISALKTSYVLKDIEVERDYYFRVIAHYPSTKSPSAPLKIKIQEPTTPEKVMYQTITAGIIGGILFFIVAIVLSVCIVKICNKKKLKAEKAYMMVTCPITDTRNGGQSQAPSPVPLKKDSQQTRVSSVTSGRAAQMTF